MVLSHEECRTSICGFCFKRTSSGEFNPINGKWLQLLKIFVYKNYDLSNPKFPTGEFHDQGDAK
jgi:uncharacterized protein Usg